MTISTSASKIVALGNGITVSFSFSFLIPQSGEEQVIFTDALGNQTVLSNTLYALIGFGNPAGGTVTYPLSGSPIPTGTSLTIARVLPLVQGTTISNQGAFYPQVVEGALDYEMMVSQQLNQTLKQAILAPIVDQNPMAQLPAAAQRAGKYLAFDSNGNPIATGAASTINSLTLNGATSGTLVVAPQATASGTLYFPNGNDTLIGRATVDTLTGAKTFNPNTMILAGATSGTTLLNATAIASGTITIPVGNDTLIGRASVDTFTGAKTFNSGTAVFAGATSGTTTVNASATASGALTLPATTDTLVGKATTDTLTNKTFDTAGAGNSFLINGLAATANTGTGAVVRATGPAVDLTNATGLPLGGSGVTGTLGIGNGGTGQVTANAALNALLPSQASQGGNTLISNGTSTAWAPIPLGYVGGRLTVSTGTPIMTATVTGATTVYFTPWRGQYVPLYNGTYWQTAYYAAELSQALSDTTKSPAAAAASSVYDIFFWNDSGTYRISRGFAWQSSSVRGTTANIFRLNGIYVNVNAITNGPGASQGTYLGTIATNASGTVDFIFGGSSSGGTAASLNVWNNYNRVIHSTFVFDTGTSYTYTSTTIRQARASTGNQVGFVCGLREDAYTAFYQQNCTTVAVASAHCLFGLGVNSTTVYSAGNEIVAPTAAAFSGSAPVQWNVSAQIGTNIIAAIESSDGTNANSFCIFGGAQISFTFPM